MARIIALLWLALVALAAPAGAQTSINVPGLVGNPNLKPELVATTDLQFFYHQPEYYVAIETRNHPLQPLLDTFRGGKAAPAAPALSVQ